jgi:hypothetical protein
LLPKYREIAAKILPSETLVYENKVKVVNHATETLGDDPMKADLWSGLGLGGILLTLLIFGADADEGRANYWIYLHNFPCHHLLPDHAETEAFTMLQLTTARKSNS